MLGCRDEGASDVPFIILKANDSTARCSTVRSTGDEGMNVLTTTFQHGYPLEIDVHKDDRSIRWHDPDLNMHWPAVILHLSVKDRHLPFLNEAELPSA